MARWSRGFVQASTPRVTRFDSQQSTFFLGGDGFILFYFETWISDSFANYLFSFYLFLMKFVYNVNRTSSDGRLSPAHFLLGHPNRQRQTVYTDNFSHGTSPVGAGN